MNIFNTIMYAIGIAAVVGLVAAVITIKMIGKK
jgi:hypothetical protein